MCGLLRVRLQVGGIVLGGDAVSIANEKEVLEYLTDVMRRDGFDETDNIRFSDSFKAAELLGRHYGLFSDSHPSEAGSVTIVDDIGGGDGSKNE